MLLNLWPGNHLGFLYPTVAFLQIHAHRLFEIRQADLAIAVTIHMLHIIPQIGLYGLKYKAFSFIQCILS